MFLRIFNGRARARDRYFLILLAAGILFPAMCPAASTRSAEVASVYKAQHLDRLQLAVYQDELLECSALAAIHMWIGDNLGNDSGAEVRKKLNNDYWINVSKSYLSLAEQASGGSDLNPELGSQMKRMAAEYRDLTESQAEPEAWASWYDRIDRCDTWRPDRPAHAFYNNGRRPDVESGKSPKETSTSGKAPT